MVTKSRMPLARQFRKWLVTEVSPTLIDTASYVSPDITLTQIAELKIKIYQMESENQQIQNEI